MYFNDIPIEELEWNAIDCRLNLPDLYKSTLNGLVDSSFYSPGFDARHLKIGNNVKNVGNYILWPGVTDKLTFNSTNYSGEGIYGPWINDTIIIGDNVKTLPSNLIMGGITEITIPSSVTLSRDFVASGFCDSLKTIYWNANSCTAIGPFYGGYGNSNFTDIVIGSCVYYIGGRAFNLGNTAIGEYAQITVTCNAMVPPVIDADCFGSKIYSDAQLRVPKQSLEAYRNAVGWKNFFKCVAIEDIPGGGGDKLLGDANGDGKVSIDDVTTLIDYLLTGDVSPFNAENADMDEDGSISINDVTALIDLLLKGN